MDLEPSDKCLNIPGESTYVEDEVLMSRMTEGKGVSVGAIGRPATVVFKSPVESTSVYVDELGNVSVSRGALPNPNIVIEGEHEVLCAVLQQRIPFFSAPGPLKITVTRGSVVGLTAEIAEGQEMEHPLKELYL